MRGSLTTKVFLQQALLNESKKKKSNWTNMDRSLFERSRESCRENSSSKQWAVIRDARRQGGGQRVCVHLCAVCRSVQPPTSYMYLNRRRRNDNLIASLIMELEYLEQLQKGDWWGRQPRHAQTLKVWPAGMGEILLSWFSDSQIFREQQRDRHCTGGHPKIHVRGQGAESRHRCYRMLCGQQTAHL